MASLLPTTIHTEWSGLRHQTDELIQPGQILLYTLFFHIFHKEGYTTTGPIGDYFMEYLDVVLATF